jgi:23S rRNA pseudouridine1911/1915/1917 synthase
MDVANGEYSIDDNRILYLDENCVVINKVAGEAAEGVSPGMSGAVNMGVASGMSEAIDLGVSPGMSGTVDVRAAPGMSRTVDLSGVLARQLPLIGNFPPQAVHRLDVPVSGCLLFARTPGALAFLSGVFAQGLGTGRFLGTSRFLEKRYWAVLEMPGTPIPEQGEIIHWITWNPRTNKSIAYDQEGLGRKKAVLRYRIIGRGERYLFMEIKLLTGRHHQIRAQLAALGLHIKGDLKYGAKRSERGGGIRLHARSLAFPNPAGGDVPIHVTAMPPLADRLWEDFGKSCDIGEQQW